MDSPGLSAQGTLSSPGGVNSPRAMPSISARPENPILEAALMSRLDTVLRQPLKDINHVSVVPGAVAAALPAVVAEERQAVADGRARQYAMGMPLGTVHE